MGGYGPTLLSTQKMSFAGRSPQGNDKAEIQEKIAKMRGHNFNFKSIEQPFMQSTMKSNYRETGGFL